MSLNSFGTRPTILKKNLADVVKSQRSPDEPRLKVDLSNITPAAPPAPVAPPEPVVEVLTAAEEAVDPRQILNSIGEVVYNWDLPSDHLTWGPNIADVLPFASEVLLSSGMGYAELLAPESPESRFGAVKDASARDTGNGVPYQVHYCLKSSNDSLTWIEDTGRWFAGSRGEPIRAHGVIRIAPERYRLDSQLLKQSKYDRLTGALTREELTTHLAESLRLAIRDQKPVSVLLATIDNLGLINRGYGYDVADELIAGLAKNLRAQMRGTDILARFAGNKFAFVLESCDPEQLDIAVKRFLSTAVKTPINTSVGQLHASVRFGGCVAPRNGRTQQVVLQHAEEALEMARSRASDRFVTYTESLVRHEARSNAVQITREITEALNEHRIELALQPIVEAATGRAAFYEALIRMRRTDGSLVQPDTFLPTAERVGLIQLLDQRMLDLVVDTLQKEPTIRVAFNVSASTAHDPEWPLRLKRALAHNPNDAKRLIVEITETFAVDNLDTTNRVIEEMKAVGVSVAMDDFGSGHTSFRGLRRLNFDVIKIDGAFIQNLARSADDRIFVRALVDLAKHIGVPMVAEWVEDAETARILTEWGVNYLQGHYFGRAELASERKQPLFAKSA